MEKKTWSVLLNAMLIRVVRVVAFLAVGRCGGGLCELFGLAPGALFDHDAAILVRACHHHVNSLRETQHRLW
jgi:hypothetical protein